ncbi:hypothetical protein PFICI_02455 [Pestalotiopsis fici W106-1]|uniref:N-acetyltransferase domain-containing protein n=1 Tax=Pestalotiopsis fici (strain W106-1 / CGMCC3.15140) TaxID=1229662 RepID=W3XEF2_PESFW|nr:uncharacterized protein PFICI_02455 [Pestalotiopsis fici W106-1]ETS84430.1 hypothetical protein PFICI_02455 [Pestalotiopsis fici W106-1]
MPLEFDPSRSYEPFLRLPTPHENIIITPPRKSDGPRVVECLNDAKVCNTLNGPPFPYTYKDFEFWYDKIEKDCKKGLQEHLEMTGTTNVGEGTGQRKWTGAVPVRSIREVDPATGAQEFIGDVGFDRQGYQGDTSMTLEQQKERRELNESYEAGDERIEWDFGDFLASSYHGRGIMTAAVHAIIEDYAVPHMNVRRIRTRVFERNIASRRVFAKNGFTFQGLGPQPLILPEDRGGHEVFLGTMMWERKPQ